MACAYKDPLTAIGLILGTGINACYYFFLVIVIHMEIIQLHFIIEVVFIQNLFQLLRWMKVISKVYLIKKKIVFL